MPFVSIARLLSVVRPTTLLAVGGVLALGACGGDDDEPAASGADATTPSIAGALDDSDLLLPRDYLQGEWCDSEGKIWSIEGDFARSEDPRTGGVAEGLPIDIVFIDAVDRTLVSQSDDEFVIGDGTSELTFTRGPC